MRKAILATTIALLAFGGITLAAAQEQFISVAGEPTGVNGDNVTIHVYQAGANDRYYGRFNYFTELDTPGLDAPAGWLGGDRVAYRCGWVHLQYRGWIVGRATYTSVGGPNEGGASVNDAFMVEGSRHYDGAPDWQDEPNRDQFDDECTNPPSGDGMSAAGPETIYPDRPAGASFEALPVVFYHGPHDIEIRDFNDLDDTTVPVHSSLRLDTVAQTERRVTLVGYEQMGNGTFRARVEIHFDVMVPGGVVPGTAHPVELRTTLEPHEEEPSPSPSPSPSPEPSPLPSPSKSPEPSPSPSPASLAADFDGDGDVDTDDLRAYIEAWIAEAK
jgi:hypothetical protein